MATANGWRVLCLDGGGTRGIVPLAVLQSLKNRTDKEPWEIFDVIVGTSTGGILAVLLGLLKVPVEDCFTIYEELGATVFEPPLFGKVEKILSTVASGHRYSATPLENVVKEILSKHAGDADVSLAALGQEDGVRPYVVLVANRDGFGANAYRFANFRSDDDDGNTLTNKVRVWEAVRATSAAPTYFDAIRIDIPGVGRGVKFYDGGVKYNNPIEVARTLLGQHPFQGKPPSLFVSLGTGMNIFKMGDVDSLSSTLKTMVCAATDSETAHEHAWQQLHGTCIPYFRFNPGEGLGDLPMDSVAFVEHMRNATQKYLVSEDARMKMKVLVEAVKNKEVSLEALLEQMPPAPVGFPASKTGPVGPC